MSYPPPPPYYGPPPPWPPPPPHHPHHHPHHPPHHYPPHPDQGHPTPAPYPYYIPGTMMIPVPVPPMPMPQSQESGQPTYITNYIYHGENSNSNQPAIESSQPQVVETSGDYDWVPTTATMASSLTGRAVVGGHEGWDGSPLWVIRGWHNGDFMPGKLSVRHNAATVVYEGKEIPVQNIEVLCAKPESLRWIPASNGNVPPGAILGGRTMSGEELYVGRVRYQLSITPGKVHPSHQSCYIGFAGTEVAHKMYDVLCRVS